MCGGSLLTLSVLALSLLQTMSQPVAMTMGAPAKPGTSDGLRRTGTAGGAGFDGPKPGTAGSMVPRATTAGTVAPPSEAGGAGAAQSHLEELQKKYRALDMARRLYAGMQLHGFGCGKRGEERSRGYEGLQAGWGTVQN